MSGGIAYVLGLDPAKVNKDMVELLEPSADDLLWLRDTVQRHRELTGSILAQSLMDSWPTLSSAFTKVMPQDYRRALEAAEAARVEGRDVDEAIMEASRG
jgi:glutamate synthase (NADPH/NADH) large chain